MYDRAAHENSIALGGALLVAFELAKGKWKLELAGGLGGDRRRLTVDAWDMQRLEDHLARARKHFGLAPDCHVVSCYEAGPDGFSVHRYLTECGIENLVVDGASCEVNRRQRRAKTDRIDATMLMNHLQRHLSGQPRGWRVVRVPSEEAEDQRHLHRELDALIRDRTRSRNRIQSLVMTHGARLKITRHLAQDVEALRTWEGKELPPNLQQRLQRECVHHDLLEARIASLKELRRQLIDEGEDVVFAMIRRLLALRAIGEESAWRLVMECFAWRRFNNRREAGAYVGLTPTPFNTGNSSREQGIGKDGNQRLRALLIELAWIWLRYQPDSALTRWFQERYARGGKRSRRVGIVALARKLFIALWHYVDHGIVPEGAILKA